MKKLTIILLVLLVSLGSCRTIKPAAGKAPEAKTVQPAPVAAVPAATDFSSNSTWILGYFKPVQLTYKPYSEWYLKGYDDYQVNTESINKLLDIKKDGITIKVVMGTWCPDSRREVPRLMRVIDMWHFPVADVTLLGVDNQKMSPLAEYGSLDIQRVPTIIIYKNNIEAGRIIENPVSSLEQDIVNILTRNEK